MIDDKDIWRAATLLIRQHGEEAAAEAVRRADELATQGDNEGCAVWRLIAAGVADLSRTKRDADEPVN